MATDLMVFGPFVVPFDGTAKNKTIAFKHGTQFWADGAVAALKLKQGCYFFAMKAGLGHTPWYVGKATKGFKQETFTKHKLGRYMCAIGKSPHGTPVMFFVAPIGAKNKVPVREINHMEKELTQDALAKNPNLCNTQNTKNLPQWSIRGVVRSNPGKPTAEEKAFKKMMGLG